MKYIFQYPETNGASADLLESGPPAELAALAELHGWDGFSFTEHPAPGARWLDNGGHQTLDPFIALAHVAAVTTRLRLLTYLAVVPYRNPLLLAKSAATVDKLSNGRFILGVGTGYLRGEFKALGVDFEERNTLFDEALDVMPMHWSGEAFNYQGLHFEAREIIGLPRPVQNPIPIWIGGNSKLSRRRVAAKAQGWIPMTTPSDISKTARTPFLDLDERLEEQIAEIRADAESQGRPKIDITVSYTNQTINDPAEESQRHIDAIAQLEAMGVDWLVVSGPQHSPNALKNFVESFGINIIQPR